MVPAQDLREKAIIVYRGRDSFERKDKVSMWLKESLYSLLREKTI